MIFVDASALIAMIAEEPEALVLAERLQRDRDRVTSAIAAWETAAGLSRSYRFSPEAARQRISTFFESFGIRIIPLAQREFVAAFDAYARFGKGHHPAALNMGDCFAYACATTNAATLLFKGDDFTKTDVKSATEG